VAVAAGNDGMGSIRIPAACCGLFGIKPGFGVVPAELGNGSWFDMAENEPLATTVADAALVLSVMAGRPELAVVEPPGSPLRIAVSTRSPVVGTRVDPAYVDAALRTADALAGAGHRVVQADPAYPTRTALAALVRWFAGTEKDAQLLDDRSRVERRVRVHAALGRLVLRAGLPKESGRRHWQQVAELFFVDHDVLVTPALAQRPLSSAPWGQRGWLANVTANSRYAPFAAPWNLAGWPAATVPAGMHPKGTPLAVQIVARPGGEPLLLQVAAQLEQLRPWPRLAPM
jgi:amidase